MENRTMSQGPLTAVPRRIHPLPSRRAVRHKAAPVQVGIALALAVGLAAVAAGWVGRQPLPHPAALASTPPPAAAADPKEPKRVYHDQYGDALPPGAVARLGSVRLCPGQWFRTAVFSPNGKILASSGFSSEGDPLAIRLWDVANGKEIGRFSGDSNYLAFSPDGDRLAVSHEMGELCLYDVVAGKQLWSWDTHSEKAHPQLAGVAFSPDGKVLAVAAGDDTVRLCETAAAKEVSRLKAKASGLVFAPDGKTLASFHYMGKTVSLWEPATGKLLQTLEHPNTVYAVAFSPDGLSLAVHPSADKVFLWDVARGKLIRQVDAPGVGDPIRFSPDGKTLLTAQWLFDLATGKETRRFDGLSGGPLSPDGRLWASGALHVRDTATGREIVPRDRHDGPISFVVPSADGKTIRTVGQLDHTIREWETDGKHLRRIETRPWQDFRALSADGKVLATPRWDKEYVLVELASGQSVAEGGKANDHVGAMALAADGKWLAVLSGDKEQVIRLGEPFEDKEPLRLQGKVEGSSSLAFSPDGKVLAAAASLDRISLWDAATGKPLGLPVWAPKRRAYPFAESISPKMARGFGVALDPKAQPSPAAGLLFSPSGKTLAVMSGHQREQDAFFDPPDAGLIRLYDATTGKERFQLSLQEAVAAFSPDGKTLATGGHPDFAVYLWDAISGEQLARFKGHRGEITSLAFSADGGTLTSGSADGTALVWKMKASGR